MRAPHKKPDNKRTIWFGGRCYREDDPRMPAAVAEYFGWPGARELLRKALTVLNPSPVDQKRLTHETLSALVALTRDDDDLEFKRDGAALTRYINALHELRV